MKREVFALLEAAAAISLKKEGRGAHRKAVVGAISVSHRGVIHHGSNGSGGPLYKTPSGHAEARLLQKVNRGATAEVYVARTTREGVIELARPCNHCMAALKNKRVGKVYYSINHNTFGVIDLSNGEEWQVKLTSKV